MIDLAIFGILILMVTCMIAGFVVLEIRNHIDTRLEEQNKYLYESFSLLSINTKAPKDVQKIKRSTKKGTVYNPSKDINNVMSGGIVDMFD